MLRPYGRSSLPSPTPYPTLLVYYRFTLLSSLRPYEAILRKGLFVRIAVDKSVFFW